MRKTWVYIAGPFSKPYPIENMHKAMQIWFKLQCIGYHAICPHWTGFQDLLTPMPYSEWLDYDRETLSRCDVVLRIPGISTGADMEVRYAMSLGKPVVYSLEELLVQHHANTDRKIRSLTASETGTEE
jgi:nucleoside 2-deoxyribosyltransferase